METHFFFFPLSSSLKSLLLWLFYKLSPNFLKVSRKGQSLVWPGVDWLVFWADIPKLGVITRIYPNTENTNSKRIWIEVSGKDLEEM